MPDIQVVRIHADQRAETTVTTGTKAWELFRDDADVVAARVGAPGQQSLKDLAYELADGDEVEGVAIDSADGRDILRHSTAHVMAQAVQQLWPEAKLGIGPPIDNGFYYDFDVETPLAGIEITTPDLEPFREATQSVYDKHADTIGADLIDAIRNA